MSKAFRERYGARSRLDDCAVSGPDSEAELFVVEGDSAASAVARVRDQRHQAVLPMQGKPINAARAPWSKVEGHPFFGPLVAALGTGVEGACDPRRLRYGRVLVLTDPDADGIHCGFLVLLFFHRWLRRLLDLGRVEVVRPPWGEVIVGGEIRLAYSEPELSAWANRGRESGAVEVRRYRGLAAVDPGLLHETCVAPATRRTEVVSSAEVASMIEVVESLAQQGEGPQ